MHVAPGHTDSVEHDHQTGPGLNNGQFNSIQVEPQQSVLQFEFSWTEFGLGGLARPLAALRLTRGKSESLTYLSY